MANTDCIGVAAQSMAGRLRAYRSRSSCRRENAWVAACRDGMPARSAIGRLRATAGAQAMNRVYRLVFNRARRVLQVASELTQGQGAHGTTATAASPRRHPLALACLVALGTMVATSSLWAVSPVAAQTVDHATGGGAGGGGAFSQASGGAGGTPAHPDGQNGVPGSSGGGGGGSVSRVTGIGGTGGDGGNSDGPGGAGGA